MNHVWAEFWCIPVEVLTDPDSDTGDPIIIRKTSDVLKASDVGKIGCLACNQGLDEAWSTECLGPKEVRDDEAEETAEEV